MMIPIKKCYDILYGPQVVECVRVEAMSSNPDINTFKTHELNFRDSLTEIANMRKEFYKEEPTRILQSIRANSNGLQPREEFVNSLFETIVMNNNVAPFAMVKDSTHAAPLKTLVDDVELVVRNLNIDELSANYHLEKNNPTVNRSMETMRKIAEKDLNDVLGIGNVVSTNLSKGRDNVELAKSSVDKIVETFTEILSYNDLIPLSALIEICNISGGATQVVHACMQHRIMIVVGIPLGFQAFHYLSAGDNFKFLLISLKKNIQLVKINVTMKLKMSSYNNPVITFVSAIGGITLTAFTGLKFGGLVGNSMSSLINPQKMSVVTKKINNFVNLVIAGAEAIGAINGAVLAAHYNSMLAAVVDRSKDSTLGKWLEWAGKSISKIKITNNK